MGWAAPRSAEPLRRFRRDLFAFVRLHEPVEDISHGLLLFRSAPTDRVRSIFQLVVFLLATAYHDLPFAEPSARYHSLATPQGGKQTKTKTLTNPQNFSYEVSQLRGAGKLAPQPDHLVEKQPEALHLHFRAREGVQQRAVLLLGLEQLAQEDADHLPVPDHAAACLDPARLRRLKELETTLSGRFDYPDPVPTKTIRSVVTAVMTDEDVMCFS